MLSLDNKDLDKHVVYLVDDSEIDEDTAAVGKLKYREYGVVGGTCEFIAASRLNVSVLENFIWKMAAGGNGRHAEIENE